MTALCLFLVALGQIASGAGRPVSDADLKLLKDVSLQSGLTRTWIPYRKGGAATLGKPDAVYRLTLPGGSGKNDQLVDAEARRYGSLLLAYRAGSDGVIHPEPAWVGEDTAGAAASTLDRFYAAIARSDLAGARQSAAAFLARDLDVAARLAALEQKGGNAADAARIVAAVTDKSETPKGLGDVLQKHLKEDGDFNAANAINFISAHRRLLGTLVK